VSTELEKEKIVKNRQNYRLGFFNQYNVKFPKEVFERKLSKYKDKKYKGGSFCMYSYLNISPSHNYKKYGDLLFKSKKTGNVFKVNTLLNVSVSLEVKEKHRHLMTNTVIDTSCSNSCDLIHRGSYENFKPEKDQFIQIGTWKDSLFKDSAEYYNEHYGNDRERTTGFGCIVIDNFHGSLYLKIRDEEDDHRKLFKVKRIVIGKNNSIYCNQKHLTPMEEI